MKCRFRVWIVVMVFFTTFTNYMMRNQISVSVVDMVKYKKKDATPTCERVENATKKKKAKIVPIYDYEKFYWNQAEQGQVLGAYFYGYFITCLLGGMLAEMLGAKNTILISSVASAILMALGPICAKYGDYGGIIANRVILGLLGGVAYPAINCLIARWAPPQEKGRFMAALMGNTLGTAVTFPLVGYVSSTVGWHWGFHITAIMMLVFCVAFFVLVRDSPAQHPWVTQEERDYIRTAQEGKVTLTKQFPPYRRILLSCPFWALVGAQWGSLWALNLIGTYYTKYLKETLGFNLKDSAGLAATPYLSRQICSAIFGYVGDYMRNHNVWTLTRIRKFFIIFSHFLPALTFFLIRALGCNYQGVVAMLILNQGLNGAVVVSHLVNPQDLAPNFAGSVFGTMNFFAQITGFIIPPISAAFIDLYPHSLDGPALIYTLGGCLLIASGTIFIVFGTAETQPWNTKQADVPTESEGKQLTVKD